MKLQIWQVTGEATNDTFYLAELDTVLLKNRPKQKLFEMDPYLLSCLLLKMSVIMKGED